MVRGGADLIEIGVPFSDPLADGATVQRTSQVALRHGVTLADAVAMARRLREQHGVSVPILLMGYFNPMLQYGLEELARDSAAAGVDGYIVPDLPAEESDELLAACRRHGLDLVFLLAPTSTDERIAAVAERASGFVYCVSLTGVTGQRAALPDLRDYLARVRARTDLPLAIGFGVSTPEHVRQVGEVADGAVVASALINFLDTVPDADQLVAAEQFVRGLRGEAPFPPQVSDQAANPRPRRKPMGMTPREIPCLSQQRPATDTSPVAAYAARRRSRPTPPRTSSRRRPTCSTPSSASTISPRKTWSAPFSRPRRRSPPPSPPWRRGSWAGPTFRSCAPMRWPFQGRYAASCASCSTSIPRARRLRFAMSTCVRQGRCALNGRTTTRGSRRFSAV